MYDVYILNLNINPNVSLNRSLNLNKLLTLSLFRNIDTICTLIFNTNGDYILGQILTRNTNIQYKTSLYMGT